MENNSQEVWRPIDGFEGLYEVSNLGRVRSLDRLVTRNGYTVPCKGRVLKLKKDKFGYQKIILSKDNKQTTLNVHRLVAMAFQEICGQFRNGLEVDHLDTNPSNNRAVNLRWCTRSENHLNPLTRKHMSDAQKSKRTGEKSPNYGKFGKDHPASKAILQYDIEGNFIAEWDSAASAGRKLGVSTGNICNALKGRLKQTHGFIFRYKTA